MSNKDTQYSSKERAKMQFESQRRQLAESFDKHLGPTAREERKRIERGGVNFALFNYLLETTDFSTCENSMDAVREVYKRFYVHLMKTVKENQVLRAITYKYIDEVEEKDAKSLEDIYKTDADPNDMVTKMLNKVKEDAKSRSKMGLKAYTDTPKIVK